MPPRPLRRRVLCLLVSAALLALLASPHNLAPAHAQSTLTIPASDDSYVVKASPSTNYNGMPSLAANGGSAKLKRIYCQFTVTGVPAGDSVAGAKLQLFATAGAAAVAVHASATGWSEATVVWPGPSYSATPALQGIAAKRAIGSYVTADVTAAVSGNGTVSFELDTASTTDQTFESKEAGKGHAPVLVISTTTPATTSTVGATTTTGISTTTTAANPTTTTDSPTTTSIPDTTTTVMPTTTTGASTTTSPPTTTIAPTSTTSATGSNDTFIVVCNSDHTATLDPIVYPGQNPAGHEHRFSGNRSTDENSTPQSLSANYAYAGGGGTSCEQGPNGGDAEDTGAYWHPTLLVDGVDDNPASTKAYYVLNKKSRTQLQPPPFGLKIVAGTSSSMMAQPTTVAYWGCGTNSGISIRSYIPDCRGVAEGALSAHILFPDCWNGVDLDSADHKSHMAYSSAGTCPAGWVPIPQLILRLNWTQATSPDPAHARLSSDMPDMANGEGFSLHADFINAWQMTQDTTRHAAYATAPQLRGLADLVDACLKSGLACPAV